MSRNHHENQCLGRKTHTVIDELLDAQCGQFRAENSRGTQSQQDPIKLWNYLQELGQIHTVNTEKTTPNKQKPSISRFLQEEGKRNPSEISQNSSFFSTRPALRTNYLTWTWLAGFYQSLTNAREGKYPTPAHSSHSSVPSKGGEKYRNTCEVNSPEAQVH